MISVAELLAITRIQSMQNQSAHYLRYTNMCCLLDDDVRLVLVAITIQEHYFAIEEIQVALL